MDIRAYYQKIRETTGSIPADHVVVVSHDTPDGGKGNVRTEVSREAAARLIVEGKARLASETEKVGRQITGDGLLNEKNVAMIQADEDALAKLRHDLQRFRFEQKTMEDYKVALNQQQKELVAKWGELFLANQRLAEQIDQLQRKAAAAIDRRSPAPPQATIAIPGEAAR